ncbi:acyltransferase family protein [uncultured Roseovarius sp.]|uniref:acyltransferase family protein n=1 Tax=uncultured Roseovarius sp. TaxID=293344 RepID=UPI00261040C8|nr:acyltransferase family protein [uncultured Roseovarius sp.]
MKYRADIDGLRAVAVLPVVAFHTGLGLSGGFVGVDIFFVISGFLITSIIFDEAKSGSFSIVAFYERRVRRIIPALFSVILLTAIAAYAIMIPSHLEDFAQSAIASAFFFANIWQYLSQGYFTEAAELKPLLHTWSLGIEEQFYIFFPPLFVWLFRRAGVGQTVSWLGILGLISFGFSIWAVANNPDAAFYLPQYRIWELVLGAVLAIAITEGWIKQFLMNKTLAGVTAFAGIALIVWSVVTFGPETQFPGLAALAPCLGAAALIASGTHVQTPLSRLLSLTPFVFVGKISYSLYLWHWPVISLYYYINVDDFSTTQGLICITLSFALAIASWRYIEQPFRQKKQISRAKVFAGFFATSAVIFTAASVTTQMEGFPDRMPTEITKALSRDGLLHDRRDCHRVTPERARNGDVCVRGDMSVEPSFMLVGDSHADAISPAIFKAAERAHLSGYHFTGSFIPLIDVSRPGMPEWPEQTDAMIEFLKQRPQIETLYIARLWLVQMTGESYRHTGRIWLDDGYDGSGTSYNPTATANGLSKFAKAFPNVRIVLLDDIPTGDELDLRTHARLLLYGDKKHLSVLGLPVAEERRQRETYEPHLQKLAAEFPNVEYRSIFKSLCGPEVCPLYDGDLRIYRDGDHLSHKGALLLTDKIYEVLFSGAAN